MSRVLSGSKITLTIQSDTMIQILAILFACLIAQSDVAIDELSPGPQMRCGVDCLFLACQQLNFPALEYRDFLNGSEVTENGTSMKSLQRYASELGAHAESVKIQTRQLETVLRNSPIPIVAIAHLEAGHYVLAYRSEGESFCVIDTSKKTVDLNATLSLPADYSGNCFLVSNAELSLSTINSLNSSRPTLVSPAFLLSLAITCVGSLLFGRGLAIRRKSKPDRAMRSVLPSISKLIVLCALLSHSCGCGRSKESLSRLNVDATEVSGVKLGTVYYSADAITPAFEVIIRNRTSQRLPIQMITSSCGCSDAAMGCDFLDPGQVAPLKVRMTNGLSGERRLTFNIRHSERLATVLHVEGAFFDSCLIEPPSVRFSHLGTEEKTRSALVYFHLTTPSSVAPQVRYLGSSSTFVQGCSIEHRATTKIIDGIDAFKHTFRTCVSISADVLATGNANDSVAIDFQIGDREKRTINASWSFANQLVAAPAKLLLSQESPNQRVVLKSRGNREFRVLKASVNSQCNDLASLIDVVVETSDEGTDLLVSLKDATFQGCAEHMTFLVIETDIPSVRPLEIPIHLRF